MLNEIELSFANMDKNNQGMWKARLT